MTYNYRDLLSKRKRNTVFLTPEDFLEACAGYFEWCESHPLQEEESWQYQGTVIRDWKSKVRPFTKKGLCVHLGIPESRLSSYRKREGWEEAAELVDQIIYTQKFENAAAGLLNSNIVSRDLGLTDKQEVTTDNVTQVTTYAYALPSNGRDDPIDDRAD
jgi:hypothetical protein